MGRTTLIIDDDLLRRLKAQAAEEGRTLSELTQEVLRLGMQRRQQKPRAKQRKLPTFSMGSPTIDVSNREHLLDRLDDR